MIELEGAISPENTLFVLLCFEGPDVYSTAGGLGTRVTELSEALATQGYTTHLIFIGDPYKPPVERRVDGRLILKRWSQWVSKYYPNGVYDGEEQKLYDYNESVPQHIYEEIARPAVEQGKLVVIMGEDWHTAEVMCRISDLLHWFGIRQRVLMLWNLNSLMSLHRINWGRLSYVTTLCTVSKYMKHKMWELGVNPLVIPNGIPARHLAPVDPAIATRLREIARQGDPRRLFLFKIGRFDPDKRWMMAIEAVARLKHSGHPVTLFVRGGIEPHGAEVLSHAYHRGLVIRDVIAQRPTLEQCIEAVANAGPADIYNLRFFLPEEFVRSIYHAADATLANSGHEPFGLVALEVMAARGIAVTGCTGEDYAISFENAIVTETDDPDEIVGYLLHLGRHPEEQERIRCAGFRTAEQFLWDQVIENLISKLEFLARKQNIVLK
ncbi:MAG: glycosyltransferase family 4 protein [Thermogemmatispora sp.]|uniref:glycosyltransferase family 4 protein n=1 Tax=Thermogemmatispora sp. TaxID=1968838 RepID=UPI00262E3EFD|nr:glycosyltransferase family 4 protein [Thermogemmatispora sp.]MBX5455579.1 glycosyltransferase family 4 protein [Thermogemmatispora sp.]